LSHIKKCNGNLQSHFVSFVVRVVRAFVHDLSAADEAAAAGKDNPRAAAYELNDASGKDPCVLWRATLVNALTVRSRVAHEEDPHPDAANAAKARAQALH
jgi:hypothetical protein